VRDEVDGVNKVVFCDQIFRVMYMHVKAWFAYRMQGFQPIGT